MLFRYKHSEKGMPGSADRMEAVGKDFCGNDCGFLNQFRMVSRQDELNLSFRTIYEWMVRNPPRHSLNVAKFA